MSTIELELFNALRKVNVAESNVQLATKGDIHGEIAGLKTDLAEAESRIVKAMADMQRWTIGVSFGSVAVLVALLKIWP